jgi:hypothetical protein
VWLGVDQFLRVDTPIVLIRDVKPWETKVLQIFPNDALDVGGFCGKCAGTKLYYALFSELAGTYPVEMSECRKLHAISIIDRSYHTLCHLVR